MQKEAMDLKENDEFISDLGVDKHSMDFSRLGYQDLSAVEVYR